MVEITADIDNIRSSWGRAASQGNLEAVEKAHKCLWVYYDDTGLVPGGRRGLSEGGGRR